MKEDIRKFYFLLLVITVLGVFFRFYGISKQPPVADEVQVAFSAENYMEYGQFGPTMAYHPNLRNILVYTSMKAIGTGAFGLRGFSLLFGVLSIPVLGLLVYRLSGNRVAASLSGFFLAVDPVHITFSRQAIQEVHTAFFFLLGTLLVIMSIKRSATGGALQDIRLPLSGVLFGLGLASKAHALFPMLVCLAFVLYRGMRDKSWRDTVFAVLSLSIVPLMVYMLTYAPWFGRGYNLSDWIFMQKALFEITVTHTGNPMDSMIDTKAWQWFIRPLMGYGNFTHFESRPFVTISMGNPLVWLFVLPSAAYLFYKSIEGRWMLLALFFAAYLPLALSPRPIWLLSSIAVTPFAYGIVGLAVSYAARKLGRKFLFAYIALTLITSTVLYPMSIGKAWQYGYLRPFVERFNPHEHEILK